MKVNFDYVLTTLSGDPIKDGETDLKLGTTVASAMLAVIPQEDAAISGNDKVEMFRIAQKATDGGEQDLTAEQIALIKKRGAKLFGALVYGRMHDALESSKVARLVKK